MTNNNIIALYKAQNNITTPLHTYTKWQELGYQVKKGEKSLHKITIWKSVKIKPEEGEPITKLIQKTSAFFTMEQVQPISE